jgi:hypothetical protein
MNSDCILLRNVDQQSCFEASAGFDLFCESSGKRSLQALQNDLNFPQIIHRNRELSSKAF